MIELILAVIGAVTAVLALVATGFVAVSTVWYRISSGHWWWDESFPV